MAFWNKKKPEYQSYGERYAPDYIEATRKITEREQASPPPAPPARSIVGGVVANLHGGLRNFENQRAVLEADIAAKTEALRQVKAAIKSIELGLTEIMDDPALNEEERVMAGEPFERTVAPMVAELAEGVTGVD